MRAIQMRRFGGPEVLEVVDVPKPEAVPGQIVVRTVAAGINWAAALIRRNRYPVTPDLPVILGNEVAGIVEQVGAGVSDLSPGMRVAGQLFSSGATSGGYAEYAVVDTKHVVVVPDSVGFLEATALMIQGLSALYLTRWIPLRGEPVGRQKNGLPRVVETALPVPSCH